MESDNPFAPGAGTQPPELTGREENLDRAKVVLERCKNGLSIRSQIFIGLRGVGKTVLLNRIRKQRGSGTTHVVFIEVSESKKFSELLVPYLREILLKLDLIEGAKDKVRIAIGALRSFASAFNFSIGDFGIGVNASTGTADSGVLEKDLSDLMILIGEAAKETKSIVVIFIDEMQYLSNEDLEAFIAAMHQINQQELPIVLFGAGLPQLAGRAGEAKSYSERLFEFKNIGPLEKLDAIKAIQEPIELTGRQIDSDALDEIVKQTEGYPYFLQEWGYHAWNTAQKDKIVLSDIYKATESATKALDESFFRVRFDRMTKGEKEYLRAMAELGRGPHKSGDIAAKLGRDVEQVAPTRSNIIAKGMIYSPQYGDNAFTVPKFDEYMKRVMPEFIPKSVRKK